MKPAPDFGEIAGLDRIGNLWRNFTRGIVKSPPMVGSFLEQFIYGTLDANQRAKELAEFRKAFASARQSTEAQSVSVEKLLLVTKEQAGLSRTIAAKLDELLAAISTREAGALPHDVSKAFEVFLSQHDESLEGVVTDPFNVPYPRNPFFTGREELLENLRMALAQESSVAVGQPPAISGLGGIGKTQAAVEYAYRYRDDYGAVLWSRADTRDSLVSSFASIAGLLQLPQRDEQDLGTVVQAVKCWLESNREWLLIVDNVEDLPVLREFVPSQGGHVLLTTRLRATGLVARRVELQKMEPAEGVLFVLRRAKVIEGKAPVETASEADRRLAAELYEETDGLPLALDQAGAFIEETPSSLAEYLEFYRAEGARLRAERGDLGADHPSVTVTFSLVLKRVAERSEAAADLLRVCAFLAPDAIPEELFTEGAQELGEHLQAVDGHPVAFAGAVKEAARFSLVERSPASKTLSIHRLVQAVLQDEMDTDTRRLWAGRVVRALAQVFPSPRYENWLRCERLLAQGVAAARLVGDWRLDSVAAGRLLNQVAFYLHERAVYEEAEPLLKRSLAISEKALGPDHPEVATTLNNLAGLYRSQGRYEEAEPLLKRALAISEKALGPDHPSVATTLNNLADLYESQGRYEEAEPLYQRSLAVCEKVLGAEHPNTTTVLRNYAGLLRKMKRDEEAAPLEARVKGAGSGR